MKNEETSLNVHGHATDHIWGMLHQDPTVVGAPVEIGLRFDCGDSGTLYLSKRQAHDVIETLNDLISQM